jgi:hypothetical protein
MGLEVTAREHVERADGLLASAAALERQIAELTPEKRLELAVVGAVSSLNADLRYTVDLAIAHALTAMALELGGFED